MLETTLDLTEADVAFPVLGIAHNGPLFVATSLTMLTQPGEWIRSDLKGSELVDSRFRRFRIVKVTVLGPVFSRWKDWFHHYRAVQLDLEPLEDTSFPELKAHLIKQIRARPRYWGEHPNDVGEVLAPFTAASSLEDVLGAVGHSDFVGSRVRDWVSPNPSRNHR